MSFAGLATAVSGMRAAQTGLAITGHNMSNSEIPGYSRQRIVQKDYFYTTIGVSGAGNAMRRGMGTDWTAIHQIRNEFLDLTYRTNNSRLSFYTVKVNAGTEIESLMGELQGAYNFQTEINNMWYSMQELSINPSGAAERQAFLANCQSFVTKANEVYNGLRDYQYNLDQQVRDAVKDINKTITRIKELNNIILASEGAGDNANDYRDERNNALDRLSELINMQYVYDDRGRVIIFSQGIELLMGESQSMFGLRYCNDDYSFVEPVITNSQDILSADTPPSEFRQYINYDKPINAERNNDYGILNGLVVARGACPIYYTGAQGLRDPESYNPDNPDNYPDADPPPNPAGWKTQPAPGTPEYAADLRRYEAAKYNFRFQEWSVDNAMVPRTMRKLDEIFNKIVSLINDHLAPKTEDGYGGWIMDTNPPYNNWKEQSYTEVFSRVAPDFANRWNGDAFVAVEPHNYYSQYSIGNVRINPELIDVDGGYNLVALSLTYGDIDDTRLLEKMLTEWSSADSAYAIDIKGNGITYRLQDAYIEFTTEIANEVHEAIEFVNGQTVLTDQANNKRMSVMSVSMDEEMSTMMRYQYAYQSAARILNVLDSMLDRIINQTGRAGL